MYPSMEVHMCSISNFSQVEEGNMFRSRLYYMTRNLLEEQLD